MNSFFFTADSSCPVPRPAPELLEIVVKQKEGNQAWRAKYIVATKVTRQDKFRQRPHHAVHSCARIWLGEIHTLTAPDGSARWYDSDDDNDVLPTPSVVAPTTTTAATGKGGKKAQQAALAAQQQATSSVLKTNAAAGLPSASPSVVASAAAAVAAASAAAANDANSASSTTTTPATNSASSLFLSTPSGLPNADNNLPALPSNLPVTTPTANQQLTQQLTQHQQIQQLIASGGMQQMMSGMNLPGMTYPASIAQFMPLLSGVLTPAHQQHQNMLKQYGAPYNKLASGPKKMPTLPDLLICLRPIEEWGPSRAPALFVQTHGGQEYLLLKHQATYVIDVAPEHEVVSVRISMKNEKPKTLRVWKFENSLQRPAVGQGQMDLDDISRSIPPGLIVPIVYPPGNGDSPFHVLHIDKELHPTLPTVVLHQLHEPQHLHSEQTFFITPLNKQQRKIRKVLLPPPPSKPSSNKQAQIHQAAAGVISAIATGANVSEASATLAATKLKNKRPKKMKEDGIGGPTTSADDGSSSDSEAAGLDGLGRKRKRRGVPPPSVAARLKATNPALLGLQHPSTHLDHGHTTPNYLDPTTFSMGGGMPAMQNYFASLANFGKDENEEEEFSDDEEDETGAPHKKDEQGHNKNKKRRKARLLTDINIIAPPQLQAYMGAHEGKFLTRTARTIWQEIKKQPEYLPQAYNKDQALAWAKLKAEEEAAKEGKSSVAVAAMMASGEIKPIGVIAQGAIPIYTTIQLDWVKLAKSIGEGTTSSDLQTIWKYVIDHMLARKVVDLDELDLRSLWGKPIDNDLLAARIRAGKSVPTLPTATVPGATFPFTFPMFPNMMFPGAAGAAGLKAPTTKLEQDQQAQQIATLAKNPFLSMFMPGLMGAANSAASASATGLGSLPTTSPDWMKLLTNPTGDPNNALNTSLPLFQNLAAQAAIQQQHQHNLQQQQQQQQQLQQERKEQEKMGD